MSLALNVLDDKNVLALNVLDDKNVLALNVLDDKKVLAFALRNKSWPWSKSLASYFCAYFSFISILIVNQLPYTKVRLLIHGNCLYELAAHVRATPLRRALNSRPIHIINVFLCFVQCMILIVRLF